MITLYKNDVSFSICNIDKGWDYKRSNKHLERNFKYIFLYEDTEKYLITLDISFSKIGYTYKDNISIVNFGYSVGVKKWSNKYQEFKYVSNLNREDGRDIRKYIKSQQVRTIMVKFIHKFINKYLEEVNPRIILRGSLNKFKVNSPRYLEIDNILFNQNYEKKVFHRNVGLQDITVNQNKGVIWCYSKYPEDFKRLKDVIRD